MLLSNIVGFPLCFAFVSLCGFLLATLGPVIVDPKLTSHIRYGVRTYKRAWLLAPLSLLVFLATALTFTLPCLRATTVGFFWPVLPLLGGILLSLPIFRPEMPHRSVSTTGVIWLILSSVWLWVRFSTAIHEPPDGVAPDAYIEYVRQHASIFQAMFLGALAGYLTVIVGWVLAMHKLNQATVSDKGQLFLLDVKSNIEIAFYSLLFFVGPFFEILHKWRGACDMLLRLPKAGPA
jgi:hypothetical protein